MFVHDTNWVLVNITICLDYVVFTILVKINCDINNEMRNKMVAL